MTEEKPCGYPGSYQAADPVAEGQIAGLGLKLSLKQTTSLEAAMPLPLQVGSRRSGASDFHRSALRLK